MKTEVDLIDIGSGNIGSISRSLERLGTVYRKVNTTNAPDGSRPIILPGVGSFGKVMTLLKSDGLDKQLKKVISSGTPVLGICIGLQVLLDESEESKGIPGLGLVPGRVVRFKQGKVPQIGWNQISPANNPSLEPGCVYFVNSFHARLTNPDNVMYTSNYYGTFCAAISTRNITAFQFHPEKSGEFGERLLQRWLANVA